MKKKIYDIVFAAQYEGLSTKEATDKLLVLFGAVGQGEQLKAFGDYAQKRMWEDGDKDLSEFVDEFLSL